MIILIKISWIFQMAKQSHHKLPAGRLLPVLPKPTGEAHPTPDSVSGKKTVLLVLTYISLSSSQDLHHPSPLWPQHWGPASTHHSRAWTCTCWYWADCLDRWVRSRRRWRVKRMVFILWYCLIWIETWFTIFSDYFIKRFKNLRPNNELFW